MESGYINVTEQDFLFYLYVEASVQARKDSPLIVWTNGGPRCTAMEGALTEVAPALLVGIMESSMRPPLAALTRNAYSWNQVAHLLFVDQPRYTGFSFGKGPQISTAYDAGTDMVSFLLGWFKIFPEHSTRKIILAGESFGGIMISGWIEAILDYNEHPGTKKSLPVTSVILVNGCSFRLEYVREHNNSEFIMEYTQAHAPWLASKPHYPKLDMYDNSVMRDLNRFDVRKQSLQSCDGDWTRGYNYLNLAQWLQRVDVRRALNAHQDSGYLAFDGCNGGCVRGYEWNWKYTDAPLSAIGRALNAGIDVNLHFGMQDLQCNYVNAFNQLPKIKWGGIPSIMKGSWKDLICDETIVGMKRSATFGNSTLTFSAFTMAGHMIPRDDPAASLHEVRDAIERTLKVPTAVAALRENLILSSNVLVLVTSFICLTCVFSAHFIHNKVCQLELI